MTGPITRHRDIESLKIAARWPGADRSSLPAKLRVGEILDMYQSFYREPADVTERIEVLELESKRKDYYRSLPGGQRQRLSVVLALIGRSDPGHDAPGVRPGGAAPGPRSLCGRVRLPGHALLQVGIARRGAEP
jgi:hypothetical protein